MIYIDKKINLSKTINFINKHKHKKDFVYELDKYGKMGVERLREATPKDSGLTADSWNYKIVHNGNHSTINFYNTNVNKWVNVAILLQYGHATMNGNWIEGVDYINPAIKPVFEQIKQDLERR